MVNLYSRGTNTSFMERINSSPSNELFFYGQPEMYIISFPTPPILQARLSICFHWLENGSKNGKSSQ